MIVSKQLTWEGASKLNQPVLILVFEWPRFLLHHKQSWCSDLALLPKKCTLGHCSEEHFVINARQSVSWRFGRPIFFFLKLSLSSGGRPSSPVLEVVVLNCRAVHLPLRRFPTNFTLLNFPGPRNEAPNPSIRTNGGANPPGNFDLFFFPRMKNWLSMYFSTSRRDERYSKQRLC